MIYGATTIDNIGFKKYIFNKTSSNNTRNPSEEFIDTTTNVYFKQVVKYSSHIPLTTPVYSNNLTGPSASSYMLNGYALTGAGSVKEYYDFSFGYSGPLLVNITDLPYLAYNPNDKFFYHPAIKNVIPFNYSNLVYDYTLKNSSGVVISNTNSAGWYLDPEAGTVTLNETPDTTNITPLNPPKLSLTVYAGPMGFFEGNNDIYGDNYFLYFKTPSGVIKRVALNSF